MKSFVLKLLSLLIITALMFSLMTACTSKNENNTSDKPETSSGSEPIKKADSSGEEVVGKYANMETYEKDGVKYGKTDSGKEVAISGDNMQKLLGEYQKVQGTGSEEERDLLDQLQVILDNAQTAE